jgi:hypothetical protein
MSFFILLASACGKDSSDRPKVPLLYSPSGLIPGGLDVTHTVKLMPMDHPEARNAGNIAYNKVAGRLPASIAIENTEQVEVATRYCEGEVCTITYKQKGLATAGSPSISYHVVDEAGHNWVANRLIVDGPMPHMKPTSFVPVFGETVSLTLPLQDQYGKPLQYAPKVTQAVATAGKLNHLACTQEACTLEYFFEQQSVLPTILLHLEGPVHRVSHTILPQEEEIKIMDSSKKVFGNPGTIRIRQGVDYISSWKRPAHAITILDHKGMDRPYFSCSADSCLSTVKLYHGVEPSLTWGVHAAKGQGRMKLEMTVPDIQIHQKEIVADYNQKTLVTLDAGVDYTSQHEALATDLVFDSIGGWVDDLYVDTPRCDAKGSCSFYVTYNGNQPFVTKSFHLKIDHYKTSSQLLKVMPRIQNSTEIIPLWDRGDDWHELVLEAGKDYQTQDGSKAKAILVKNSDGLKFRDVSSLNDSNRSQVFQCDEAGRCRTWIRKYYSFTTLASINYAVQTASGTSALVFRGVSFKKDEIKVLNPSSLSRMIGKALDQQIDEVNFALERDKEYTSIFPAEKLQIAVSGKSLVLENGLEVKPGTWEVPCQDSGRCEFNGKFRTETGALDLTLTLVNKHGSSSSVPVRLVREQFTSMMPNLAAITLAENGSEEFDVTLEQGPGKGYDGDIRARRLQVETAESKLLNGTPVPDSSFVEYPCSDEGRCTFRILGGSRNVAVNYRFLDGEGRVSHVSRLIVEYPERLALSTSARVPAEVHAVRFSVPHSGMQSSSRLLLELPEGMTARITQNARAFDVALTLNRPFVAGEEHALPFRIQTDGMLSNKALVTLTAFQPLSLKPGLVIPAKMEADGTWTVTLSYSEHFHPLPANLRVSVYFSSLLLLTLENNPNIIPGALSCNNRDACTLEFFKVEGASLSEIKGEVKQNERYKLTNYHVKEGSFTIRF